MRISPAGGSQHPSPTPSARVAPGTSRRESSASGRRRRRLGLGHPWQPQASEVVCWVPRMAVPTSNGSCQAPGCWNTASAPGCCCWEGASGACGWGWKSRRIALGGPRAPSCEAGSTAPLALSLGRFASSPQAWSSLLVATARHSPAATVRCAADTALKAAELKCQVLACMAASKFKSLNDRRS